MGIQQYKDGEWVSIADGHNGKPIDRRSEASRLSSGWEPRLPPRWQRGGPPSNVRTARLALWVVVGVSAALVAFLVISSEYRQYFLSGGGIAAGRADRRHRARRRAHVPRFGRRQLRERRDRDVRRRTSTRGCAATATCSCLRCRIRSRSSRESCTCSRRATTFSPPRHPDRRSRSARACRSGRRSSSRSRSACCSGSLLHVLIFRPLAQRAAARQGRRVGRSCCCTCRRS